MVDDKNNLADKRYVSLFSDAQQQSSAIDVKHISLGTDSQSYSKEGIYRIIMFGIGVMKSMGIISTSIARNQCMVVHYAIHKALESEGISTELTIGNVTIKEKPFSENLTLELLKKEVSNPSLGEALDCHCWLTMQDGSVLDFTIYSNLTPVDKPEPLERNYVFIRPFEHDPKHYYTPMLVGADYLERIRAVNPQFRFW